jgi:hypothetical protein
VSDRCPDCRADRMRPCERLTCRRDQWADASKAAAAIRAAIADPASAGERRTTHLLMARPRRGVWLAMWANLPGLVLDCGRRRYSHAMLPGWEYTVAEMRTEMIDDLEHFAKTGEQPKIATRRSA